MCAERLWTWRRAASVAILSVSWSACVEQDEPEDDPTPVAALAISGRWASSFGGVEAISSESWGSAKVVEYDNGQRWAVTQNSATAEYNAGKFNKLVWTQPKDGVFYYCWVDFGLDTAQAAKNSDKTADDSNPDESGCGDFSWTKVMDVTLAIQTLGTYTSSFGDQEVITPWMWGSAKVVEYDNGQRWAVTQNSATAEYNAGKFNKLVWTQPKDGVFYYCWVDFGLDTAQAAKNSDKTADDSNPDESGCGDFSWTKLSPAGAP